MLYCKQVVLLLVISLIRRLFMRKATTQAAATTAADTPKKTRATRQNAPKKAHTPPVDVHLQVGGQDYDCAAIVEMARADYRATHKTGIHSCRV